MTIRELHEITPPRTTIFVGMGGNCHELDRGDPVDLAVYGGYIIGHIIAADANEIEADIKILLAREND